MRHAIRRRVDTGLLVGVAGRGAAGLGAASMLMQVTMNWAQKTVSSTGATVIYARGIEYHPPNLEGEYGHSTRGDMHVAGRYRRGVSAANSFSERPRAKANTSSAQGGVQLND